MTTKIAVLTVDDELQIIEDDSRSDVVYGPSNGHEITTVLERAVYVVRDRDGEVVETLLTSE